MEQANQNLSPLQQLLHASANNSSDLFAVVSAAKEGTRKREEQGSFVTELEVVFETSEVGRLFDGTSRDDSTGQSFTPGFHHLDNVLRNEIIPAYLQGCPIAAYVLVEIENKISIIETDIESLHVDFSARYASFMSKTGNSYHLSSAHNTKPLIRSVSFSSPQGRQMVQVATQLDRLVKVMRLCSWVEPKINQLVHTRRSAVFGSVRNVLQYRKHYTHTGANALDFAQNNAKAVAAYQANSKVKLPEGFSELIKDPEYLETNLRSTYLFRAPKTAEEIQAATNDAYDASVATSEADMLKQQEPKPII